MGGQLRAFDRMRRQRNDLEYPSRNAPPIYPSDVREDITKTHAIIDIATTVLDQMSPF